MPKKILIVDDDRNIAQILYTALNAKGYLTLVARNGEDALKKFEEEKPNLILLDVLLPKISGWDICRKIKDSDYGEKTVVIIMTALYRTMKHRSDSIYKYGANDFIEKPFQLNEVIAKIVSYIGEPDISPSEQVSSDNIIQSESEKAISKEKNEDNLDLKESYPQSQAAESTSKQLPISLTGSLKDTPFPQLLHSLYKIRETGVLYLKNNNIEKEIDIKDGYPISIRSNVEDEYLGNFLARIGKITQEECADSLKIMKSTNRLQGVTLIEMGLLTPQELAKYLKLQARDKLFEIFGWEDGTYKFEINHNVTGDISVLDMSPATLIFEGIKKRYRLERLRKELDAYHMKFVAPTNNLYYRFQDIELSPEEQKIKSLIEGDRMVGEVLSLSEMDLIKTYQLLYTLYVTEMIELRDTPSGGLTQPSQDSQISPAEDEFRFESDAPLDAKEASELREKILKTYETIQNQNHYEVLGLTPEADEKAIKEAYHKLAKIFHPDRFFGKFSDDVKIKVEEIFKKISDAYIVLSDSVKKDEYLGTIGKKEKKRPSSEKVTEEVKMILEAEKHFQKGLEFLNMRNYIRATEEFQEANRIRPQESDYLAYLGWAMFNLPLRETDGTKRDKELAEEELEQAKFNAREMLNKAIQMNPRNDKAYVFLGNIYKKLNQKEFAFRQYEKALICNPNCVEALRELRFMKIHQQRGKVKKKTFFEKLIEVLNKPIGGGKKK